MVSVATRYPITLAAILSSGSQRPLINCTRDARDIPRHRCAQHNSNPRRTGQNTAVLPYSWDKLSLLHRRIIQEHRPYICHLIAHHPSQLFYQGVSILTFSSFLPRNHTPNSWTGIGRIDSNRRRSRPTPTGCATSCTASELNGVGSPIGYFISTVSLLAISGRRSKTEKRPLVKGRSRANSQQRAVRSRIPWIYQKSWQECLSWF